MSTTANIRINNIRPLISPEHLLHNHPISEKCSKLINHAREQAANILHGKDKRKLVIIGPCSIHDTAAALEYATRLKKVADKYQEQLLIIMRVYFEKPRTTVGWKGLINDPNLNNTFDINHGLEVARKLLLDINEVGLPTGTEFLDTIIPQYISDLISWAAIGARTTQSQIHRELSSGLSMPVGFKNGTIGNVDIAANAILSAQNPHHFLGVTPQGIAAIVSTKGNPNCHVILRGSNNGPNYDAQSISDAIDLIKSKKLTPRLMVDCSHGNSNKDHTKQMSVLQSLCDQIKNGSEAIMGVMLESNLTPGKQGLEKDKTLTYGQSITDACIGWDETEQALALLSETVKESVN